MRCVLREGTGREAGARQARGRAVTKGRMQSRLSFMNSKSAKIGLAECVQAGYKRLPFRKASGRSGISSPVPLGVLSLPGQRLGTPGTRMLDGHCPMGPGSSAHFYFQSTFPLSCRRISERLLHCRCPSCLISKHHLITQLSFFVLQRFTRNQPQRNESQTKYTNDPTAND